MRLSLWSFVVGGGHFIFHADAEQETPQTGIMGYDPHVPGGDTGVVRRDWIGLASRFFNEHVGHLDALSPHNELVSENAYCLANPPREWIVYAKLSGEREVRLDMRQVSSNTIRYRVFNPRTGQFGDGAPLNGGDWCCMTKPDDDDWVMHVVAD